MTFRADLKAFLSADTNLTDIVGTRVHPVVGISKEDTPYITFSTISNPGMFHTLGVTELTTETIQFSCWGKDATEAYLAAEQLRATLNGFYGNMGSTFVQGTFLKNESDSDIKPTDATQKYYISRILVFDFTYIPISIPLSPPQFESSPTISGGDKEGDTSIMVDGVYSGNPTPILTRGWRRDGNIIDGATGSSYTKVAADVGTTTTGFNKIESSEGEAEANSNGIYVGVSPSFTSNPIISGTPNPNETITATNGTVTGDPTPIVTYEWYLDSVATGNTTTSYVVQSGDIGKQLTYVGNATNGIGNDAQSTSNALDIVSGYIGLGDLESDLEYGYSNQRLYAGVGTNNSNIRVISTQSDIGYEDDKFSGTEWDTATSSGSNIAYGSTRYDQASSNDVVQTVTTAQPVVNRDGSFSYDGTNYCMKSGAVVSPSDNFSCFIHVNFNSFAAQQVLMSQDDVGSNRSWLFFYHAATNQLRLTLFTSSGVVTASVANASTVIGTGVDKTIGFSYNSVNGTQFYIDGSAVTTTDGTSGTITAYTVEISIGCFSDGTASRFNGDTNTSLIYYTELTAQAHSDLYDRWLINDTA